MPSDAIPHWDLDSLEFWARMIQTAFVFAFGACAGSLINVLAYRMPQGLSVVHPPSRCPSCHTRLTWRENIPILGWVLLRGRCRFCRSKISPEYPLVEFFVASLFAVVYILWYAVPPHGLYPAAQPGVWLGFDWSVIKPEWAIGGFAASWPLFVMTLVMLGSLVAMTLCDARTYMIPLQLAWTPGIVGVLAHFGWGLYLDLTNRGLIRNEVGWTWAIASPGASSSGGGWWMVGASIGGMVGLAVANVLVSTGLIRRSFADYQAWEDSVRPKPTPFPPIWGWAPAKAEEGAASNPPEPVQSAVPTPDGSPADFWLEYPHARREMFKELCFLSPVITLAVLGGWIAMSVWGGPAAGVTPGSPYAAVPAANPIPMWLDALSGSLFGLLIGGGVVWLVRILGSLAFGREALGLGDAHLMAGVGACVGWIDATLAFFLSAFVGILITIAAALRRGQTSRALPLGPSLAIATLLVVLGKVFIERGLGIVAPQFAPIRLP
jgi:leader peptidase (prepilin peptidase) / N-methyltransferase